MSGFIGGAVVGAVVASILLALVWGGTVVWD